MSMDSVARIALVAFLACIGLQTAMSRVCSVKELSVGRWVPHNATRKPYICCLQAGRIYEREIPYNKEVEDQCGPRSLSINSLYNRSDDTHYNIPFAPMRCSCDYHWNSWTTPNPLENWRWQPSDCELMQINTVQFCHNLGDRKIFFMGDSLMLDFFTIINNMILRDQQPGSCVKQLHFQMFFTADETGLSKLAQAVLRDVRPAIVILNMGLHYHDLPNYLRGIDELWKNITAIRQQSSKPIDFIWKSNVFPHEKCTLPTFPYTSPLLPEEEVRPSSNSPYGWQYIPTMDSVAHSLASVYNYTYWDVQALRLRPDAHPGSVVKNEMPGADCLHMCSPGPQDILANYLHHYLFWHSQSKRR